MQTIFDNLYAKSQKSYNFHNLMEIITSTENIKLAFRNIKANHGSKTSGTNNRNITDIMEMDETVLVEFIKNKFSNYQPQPVRRVYIPKPNGDKRPLGIPTIEDRIIQQCILQVLEPICEARFHPHSYGFRLNRSTHHAMARATSLINIAKLNYVVDIDIKGFFDNVDHSKLIKQMWSLGIQDKSLICIIGKMLKSPIDKEGIPTKGTPQGGILSPLLSNIVLNELDWWISNQWETFNTIYKYNGLWRYSALRKNSKLKEMYIVRYADDFKIHCRSYNDASKIFNAVKQWLKERLNLDISPNKSKIINLRRNFSEFLGFKLNVKPRKKRYVCYTYMSDKAKNKCADTVRRQLKMMRKHPTEEISYQYNAIILGIRNYYQIATHVSIDFSDIEFSLIKTKYNCLKGISTNKGELSRLYSKYFSDTKQRKYFVKGVALFPLYAKHKNPLGFTQGKCNYTREGRMLVHNNLTSINNKILHYLLKNPIPNRSIQYNDNRISRYVGQQGKCYITKRPLNIGNMHCHHVTPIHLKGTDDYKNLIFILKDVHILIHATVDTTIKELMNKNNFNENEIALINKYRVKLENTKITV
ncbi:MAG: group II intron reverse transcriptase/maturase [Clostridiaceae bacterium]|nr:group II intron reverse transcriptase/maturase [Clostridiaceae bacterium]